MVLRSREQTKGGRTYGVLALRLPLAYNLPLSRHLQDRNKLAEAIHSVYPVFVIALRGASS